MRKTIIFLALLLLFSGTAYAASLCTDTDSGKNYGTKGTAKYAITEKEDICVISPSAEIRQDTSQYIKEYYCTNDNMMKSEIVDCAREGFEKCELGKCIGGTAEAKLKDANYTPPPPEPECGNSVIDPGEECDPMNKICFDADKNVGLCNAECKCEIKITSDGTKKEENKTEENKTIEIIKPTEKEAEQEDEAPVVVKPKEDEKITVEISEKPKEEAKPKGFFSKIWAWIAGLFS